MESAKRLDSWPHESFHSFTKLKEPRSRNTSILEAGCIQKYTTQKYSNKSSSQLPHHTQLHRHRVQCAIPNERDNHLNIKVCAFLSTTVLVHLLSA